MNKPIIENLNGNKTPKIPFWLMRQAGRYLPEYREIRKKSGGFLNLVYNPDAASEVTMQPIRRFGMDATILFSDILVIPQALGQDLKFETGEGPKLNSLKNLEDIEALNFETIDQTLNPIYQTVAHTKSKLLSEGFKDTALIGFAGSPWTLACYMIEGGGSKTFEKTKRWAYGNPNSFKKLIDLLVQANIHYLSKQIEAGADAIQLFDSWAGVLNEDNFKKWVIEPTAQIVSAIKKTYPTIPIIGFPRDSGDKSVLYAKQQVLTR
jgi:uroporphyrinogen decarboxylase